jgi:hypothetical protein
VLKRNRQERTKKKREKKEKKKEGTSEQKIRKEDTAFGCDD